MCLMVARTLRFRPAIICISIFVLFCITLAWSIFALMFPTSINDDGTVCPDPDFIVTDPITGEIDKLWCSSFFGMTSILHIDVNDTEVPPWRAPRFTWGPSVGWFCALVGSLFSALVLALLLVVKDKGSLIDNYEELKIFFKKVPNYTDEKDGGGTNFFSEKLREIKGIPNNGEQQRDQPNDAEVTPTQMMARWFRKDM